MVLLSRFTMRLCTRTAQKVEARVAAPAEVGGALEEFWSKPEGGGGLAAGAGVESGDRCKVQPTPLCVFCFTTEA